MKNIKNYHSLLDAKRKEWMPCIEEKLQLDAPSCSKPAPYGPWDMLALPAMDKPRACLYEDVPTSALTDSRSGPAAGLFQGLQDTSTLELVLCWGDRVGNAVFTQHVTREKEKETRVDYLPCLNVYTVPGKNYLDGKSPTQRRRALRALGCYDPDDYADTAEESPFTDEAFLEKLSKNLSIRDDRPIIVKEILENASDDFDLHSIAYSFEDYLAYMRMQLSRRVENDFEKECPYTLPTCSLTKAFQVLGLREASKMSYSEQLGFLQDHHMITPSAGAVNPYTSKATPFGHQCGLLFRSTMNEENRLQREAVVLLPALEYFRQGVAYPLSRRVRPEGYGPLDIRLKLFCRESLPFFHPHSEEQRLDERLRRLESFMPSSVAVQEILWPQAQEALKKAVAVPLKDLIALLPQEEQYDVNQTLIEASNLNSVGYSKYAADRKVDMILWDDEIAFHLEQASFLEVVSRLACCIVTQEVIYDSDSKYHQAICILAEFLLAQPEAEPLPESSLPLERRLENLTPTAPFLALGRLTIAEFFQTVAMFCESSFPLWQISVSPLLDLLHKGNLKPSSTLAAAVETFSLKSVPANLKGVFYYLLLIMPLAIMAPCPDKIPLPKRCP